MLTQCTADLITIEITIRKVCLLHLPLSCTQFVLHFPVYPEATNTPLQEKKERFVPLQENAFIDQKKKCSQIYTLLA